MTRISRGAGGQERHHVGSDRGEPPTGRVVEQLPAMSAIERSGHYLEALAAGLDRLVHGTGLLDRHIAVVGGDHEHRRRGELLDGSAGIQRDAADEAGRVGLARQRDHRGDRGLHPGPGDQHCRAAHGRADQPDLGDAAAAQLGDGGSDVVDHPAAGDALRTARPPKAAQVDGEGAQTLLGEVVGERPGVTQVGGVLVDQDHPSRAAAHHDPVEAGPVGCREADQVRPGVGCAAADARLLQRLQCHLGRRGRLHRSVAVGARGARAGGDEQHHKSETAREPTPSPAVTAGRRRIVHGGAPRRG